MQRSLSKDGTGFEVVSLVFDLNPDPMNYRFTDRKSVQVLYLYRLLSDLDNRAILDEVNRRVQDGSRTFVVDISQMQYIDSTGLNLLLALWKHLRHCGATLQLTDPHPTVMRLLEMTRLKAIFDFVPAQDTSIPVQ